MKKSCKTSNFSDANRVFRMVKGFSKMIALSSLIRTICKLSSVVLAVALAQLVASFIAGKSVSIGWWMLALGIMLITVVAVSYLDTYVSHDVSFKIVKQLQDKMYAHMDKIAPGGLKKINSADSATIILSDINVFEWFVAHCLVEWIGTFTVLLTCLAFIGRFSVFAAVVVFVFLSIMFVIPFLSTKQAREKGFLMKRLFGELNGIVSDGVSGYKDIVGFHWTTAFFNRLRQVSETYSKAQEQFALKNENERTLEAIVSCFAIVTGVLISALELSSDNFSMLIPIFALCTATVVCVQGTLSESTNFGFVFGAAARMCSIFDIQAPVEDTGTKKLIDICEASDKWKLSLEKVSFRYPESEEALLDEITFQVDESEIVAIVAASGGGKSTIAKLLQRFWDVDSGSICVNGVDIRDMKLESLRDIVTVVPQDIYLFHGTLKDNLKLVRSTATDREIEAAAQMAQASFIHNMPEGLNTNVGTNGVMLSGGERQRIALTQAFLKNSPILVLDEATSALDAENEQRINSVIREYRRGKITLVIAHRISSMKAADRVVFIKNGAVCETGTYNKLMQACDDFRELVRGEYLEKE